MSEQDWCFSDGSLGIFSEDELSACYSRLKKEELALIFEKKLGRRLKDGRIQIKPPAFETWYLRSRG